VIDIVHVCDISSEAARIFTENMRAIIPGAIKIVDTSMESVAGMDLVDTSGLAREMPT